MLAFLVAFFLAPFALFSFGEAAPSAGTGTVAPPPPKLSPARFDAQLTLKSTNPFVVSGRRFKSGESVRVSNNGATKRVRASRKGTFTVLLAGIGGCNSGSVTAVGSKGSRAALNFSQLVCPAP
jgi:hypothetical protein